MPIFRQSSTRARYLCSPRRSTGSWRLVHSSWLPGVHTTVAYLSAMVRSAHSMSGYRSPTSPASSSQSSSLPGVRPATISRFCGCATCRSLRASSLGVVIVVLTYVLNVNYGTTSGGRVVVPAGVSGPVQRRAQAVPVPDRRARPVRGLGAVLSGGRDRAGHAAGAGPGDRFWPAREPERDAGSHWSDGGPAGACWS